MNSVELRRDPFARATLERRTVPKPDRRPCIYCGNRPGRYVYAWVPDSIGHRFPARLTLGFCSIGCWEAYA